MLGKRFRRSTSMSQLGPASNHPSPQPPPLPEPNLQGMPDHSMDACYLHIHPPSSTPIQKEWYQDGAGADCQREDATGSVNMSHDFDPSGNIMLVDTILAETPPCEKHAIETYEKSMSASAFHVQPLSPLLPYQMGLWTTHHQLGFVPHSGIGKLQHMAAEASIMAPVDFLEVCFHCKRRLTHERDIFIYRGDSAFCSEECRHRQILSDERRSRRGTSSKRGGARTSETAVAA